MSIKSSKIKPQNLEDAQTILAKLGCSEQGVKILAKKMIPLNILLTSISAGSANILKQEALAIGIDVAVHKMAVVGKIEKSDAIIIGNIGKISLLLQKLEKQKKFLDFDKICQQIQIHL